MTCQTITIARRDLGRELDRIRRTGGVIAHCAPAGDLCELTYWSDAPVGPPLRARRVMISPKSLGGHAA